MNRNAVEQGPRIVSVPGMLVDTLPWETNLKIDGTVRNVDINAQTLLFQTARRNTAAAAGILQEA